MGKDKRKKANFDFEIKLKFKKILETDAQILAHLLKENLNGITDQIKNFVDDNVIETDLKSELDKQMNKPLKQLEKIDISPEVMDRISQAGEFKEVKQIEIEAVPQVAKVTGKEKVITVPPVSSEPVTLPELDVTQTSTESGASNASDVKIPEFTPQKSAVTTPSIPEISFSIPRVSMKKEEDKSPSIIDEEDVATGIAILRKQMLLELKKIRSVVAEEDEF
ncbi:MAG: hypothetical protein ACTSP4_14595 [Candidatus Hodarchaeales archaeon]